MRKHTYKKWLIIGVPSTNVNAGFVNGRGKEQRGICIILALNVGIT